MLTAETILHTQEHSRELTAFRSINMMFEGLGDGNSSTWWKDIGMTRALFKGCLNHHSTIYCLKEPQAFVTTQVVVSVQRGSVRGSNSMDVADC